MRAVDRSFDDLFRDISVIPLRFVDEKRKWEGSVMTFALSAKMGIISAPIRGTVEVTDRDLTIEADLGILERLITPKTREALTSHVKGLLT